MGANRWRNAEDDLPADFEDNRDVHYAALGQPQDAEEFIAALQGKLRTSLDRFEQALTEGTTGGVAIVKKHGEPWIRVSPRGKQEEPESLVAIKGEIERRWGTIDLLDILKYAEFDTGFITEFTSVATRETLSKDVLRRRLLLVLFGLGTNMGIKRVAVTGKHGERMLALYLLQSALVHVNTLLMQEVLADPKWADKLTDADRRALSPLFWTHVNPYGRFELDMNSRLDLDLSIRATVPGPRTPQDETAAAPA